MYGRLLSELWFGDHRHGKTETLAANCATVLNDNTQSFAECPVAELGSPPEFVACLGLGDGS